MDQGFDIQAYMTRGVERVVADSIKATATNPKESAFMFRFAAASMAASKKRAESEKNGEHVPPVSARISCSRSLQTAHSLMMSILSCLTAAAIWSPL